MKKDICFLLICILFVCGITKYSRYIDKTHEITATINSKQFKPKTPRKPCGQYLLVIATDNKGKYNELIYEDIIKRHKSENKGWQETCNCLKPNKKYKFQITKDNIIKDYEEIKE
ncbi:hypothetical protein [Clostridium botulinum]|uniref:hypothetical protein n=1 Tax=Clostridium botulinum TaxID=1491 RepID=UPI000773F02C|nr:hypothetical protein [Clostridium botulinum]APH20817.1 hypothetical protein NPD1_4085 [Clostridium botulinum]APQ71320.1 hypothetical protein RSJ8_4321 [Clostridium botulinum]MBN3379099.1 hypothetical protein [Clostridium botulinum]QDY26995.1 hypothetical protein CGQ40_20030 [Clostridium botulinum]